MAAVTKNPVSKDGITVIIAMDGSEFADYALKFYVDCLHRPGNHIICAHKSEFTCITDPITGNISDAVAEMAKELKDIEEKSAEFVVNVAQKMKELGVHGTTERVRGDIGPAIINLAKEKNASYIVVGCRGKGKTRKTFTGSVTDYISHHSHIPVLVVRNEEHLEQLHDNAHAHLKHVKKHAKKQDTHTGHPTKASHEGSPPTKHKSTK
ncbi:universal stress protein YxiE-like [Ruditapes philippinarum]|uniref:universal stress protein YxiE-like n=1 Tax=Ruditapes philippinarum TaxID=129788 RepID=UPI00295BCB23|nr:universal stress protein YxiE-like [Ruditapes philippinarum]